MFRDLKEYQQIQKIYEERVCITEEERYITKELRETFTEDEINFIAENTEEVFAEINNQLVEEGSEIAEETIDEMAKAVAKALPLAQRMAAGFAKNVAKKAPTAGAVAKKTASGGGGLMKKASGLVKKGVGFVKKNVGKVAGAVGVGGAAAGAAIATRGKPEKKLPTTAEIRAKDAAAGGTGMSNIPKAEGDAVIDGKKLNPDFKKKPEIKKEGPQVSTMTKQGKKRTPAQMMAAKRKAEGKTIQQVKDENKASMQANARARNVEFRAKKRPDPKPMPSNPQGGVSGKGKVTDDFSKDPKYQSTAGTSTDIKKPVRQMGRSAAKRRQMAGSRMEEYTPYDIVLEYLLSSKQAATIEEANYIMTEMDAKTIQSIVAE